MVDAVTIASLLSLLFLCLAVFYLYRTYVLPGGGRRKGKVGAYDPKTGIGRGAPGFQTNVKRVAVPAHIIARIRAGEEVSAEEITAAQEEQARRQAKAERSNSNSSASKGKSNAASTGRAYEEAAKGNEWLPAQNSPSGRARKGGKK